MKKHLLLFVLSGFVFITMNAQNEFKAKIVNEDYITTSNTRYSRDLSDAPDDIKGSPYLDENFQKGIIYENGEVVVNDYFFRYNAYEDDIEVKDKIESSDSDIFLLKKASNILVKIENQIFVFDEGVNGYYQVLFMGGNFKLYKQFNKKYYPAKIASTSFEQDQLAEYLDNPEYYLISTDGTFNKVPKSKNKRIKFFGNNSNEIKKFVSSNNLNIEEEEILIKSVRYFDSFNDASLK